MSEWVRTFSASDKQILRDVASSLRSQWRSLSEFWDEIVEQESQQRKHEQLMEQRKFDLHRQNIHQFRLDGDATTRELDEALGEESNQKRERPKRSSAEVAPELESADALGHERPTKKVAFLDDVFSSECGTDYIDSNPTSTRSSLNSIDFKYIDHLVGPGTTSSRLNTSSRLTVGNIDVSEVLMNARRDNVKKQCEISDVSNLLTINFIFDENFLRKRLPTGIVSFLVDVTLPRPTTSEMELIADFSIFASSHSYQESKRHLRNKIREKEDSIASAILLSYTVRPGLWQQNSSHPASMSSLSQNEDTHTQSIVKSIIFGIIRDLDVVDHCRDPLPTHHGFEELYFPNYFAEFDNIPLFVVEIKKPGAVDDDLLRRNQEHTKRSRRTSHNGL
ncbi:hypothetical protein BGZ72_003372 [Mortierella alpina]|nr:hypothetical protein BGZ72_003372 [Mortierella alpina]